MTIDNINKWAIGNSIQVETQGLSIKQAVLGGDCKATCTRQIFGQWWGADWLLTVWYQLTVYQQNLFDRSYYSTRRLRLQTSDRAGPRVTSRFKFRVWSMYFYLVEKTAQSICYKLRQKIQIPKCFRALDRYIDHIVQKIEKSKRLNSSVP